MIRFIITAGCLAAVCLVFFATAVAQQSPDARIADATMALAADDVTKAPIEKTASYLLWSDTFTCCVDMADVFTPTLLKSSWYYIENGERQLIDTTVIRVEANTWVAFTLTHSGHGWPYGDYAIEISLNDQLEKLLIFSVEPTYSESEITEIVISSAVNEAGYPLEPAAAFQPTIESIYACVYLYAPAAMRTLHARWYQIFEGEEDYLIDEAVLKHGDTGWLMFSLTPTTPLPSGKYYVEILMDGGSIQNQAFTVK